MKTLNWHLQSIANDLTDLFNEYLAAHEEDGDRYYLGLVHGMELAMKRVAEEVPLGRSVRSSDEV